MVAAARHGLDRLSSTGSLAPNKWGTRMAEAASLKVSVWRGTDPKNQVFYQDLKVKDAPVVELLKGFDADYSFIANDGPTFYFRTDLDAKLKARGIDRVVIAGMQTEYCVDTSVRSAMSHGYKVVLGADAHSTFDSPDLKAADIVAHHNRVLRSFAEILPAAEIAL